jgi:hypothetical protein
MNINIENQDKNMQIQKAAPEETAKEMLDLENTNSKINYNYNLVEKAIDINDINKEDMLRDKFFIEQLNKSFEKLHLSGKLQKLYSVNCSNKISDTETVYKAYEVARKLTGKMCILPDKLSENIYEQIAFSMIDVLEKERILKETKMNAKNNNANSSAGNASAGNAARVNVDASGSNLHAKTLATISALQKAGAPIYQRGGVLVRVRDNVGKTAAEKLVFTKMFVNKDDNKFNAREIHPPNSILENVLACAQWPFEFIEGIHQSPTMDKDGNIVSKRGYNAALKLYIDTKADITVPDNPTDEQVKGAINLLDDLFTDFCFERESDKANAIALLLTAVLRPMIVGNVPAFCIHAPVQGSGKTLLGKTIIAAATGREPFAMTYSDDESENSKRLDSAVLAGTPVIFLDNVKARVTNTALAALLTSPDYSMRILGESKNVCVHSTSLILLTGNNPQFDADNGRRVISIRLDPNVEHPELLLGKNGDKWKHNDPITYAIENHSKIVEAVLTLARNWVTNGKTPGGKTLGSFDNWARIIGGILENTGNHNFMGNIDDFLQGSIDETLTNLISVWHKEKGDIPVDAKELGKLASDNGIDIRSMGAFIKQYTGRIVNGLKITIHKKRPTLKWKLV